MAPWTTGPLSLLLDMSTSAWVACLHKMASALAIDTDNDPASREMDMSSKSPKQMWDSARSGIINCNCGAYSKLFTQVPYILAAQSSLAYVILLAISGKSIIHLKTSVLLIFSPVIVSSARPWIISDCPLYAPDIVLQANWVSTEVARLSGLISTCIQYFWKMSL